MADDISVHSDRSTGHRRSHSQRSKPTNRRMNHTSSGNCQQVHSSSAEETPFVVPSFSAAKSESVKVDVESSDDRWGDNTTVVTGNTSEHSYSCENVRGQGRRFSIEPELSTPPMSPLRCIWLTTSMLICTSALLSPMTMVLLPSAFFVFHPNDSTGWPTEPCALPCEGHLLSLSFKLLLLMVGMWAVFLRRAVVDLPRLFVARAALLALVIFLTFAYWLFYVVRVVAPREPDYASIVAFSLSLADSLLFVHYLAVLLLELRHLRPEYKITVVRSPDGHSRTIQVGFLSIQRAAVDVLRSYYTDFPVYNPFLDRSFGGRMKLKGGSQVSAGFKLYSIENDTPIGDGISDMNAQALMMATARRREKAGHNERFYDELDWERRVRKRKCRLIGATEDAFAHVRRIREGKGPCLPMDSYEAAQAVFPALARPLQKYLRITRQQPRHTAEQVVRHLAQCLSFDMGPRSFLDRFFTTGATFETSTLHTKWSIVCGHLASRTIDHGTVFQLRCHSPGPEVGVLLLCTVTRLPFFNLTEAVLHFKTDKFTLRLSSETSV